MLAENTELVRLATEPELIEGAPEPRWLDAVADFHRATPKASVVFTDLAVVAGAVLVAGANRAGAVAAAVSFVAVAVLCRVYEKRGALDAQGLGWYVRSVSLPILAATAALSITGHSEPGDLLGPLVAMFVALVVLRGGAWAIVAGARRRGLGLEPALIIGPGDRTHQVARRIEAFPESGLKVAATYAPADTNGDRTRARRLLRAGAVGCLLVADARHDEPAIEQCVAWSEHRSVELALVLPVGTAVRGAGRIGDLGVIPLGHTADGPRSLWAKRLLDMAVSGLLLLLLAPAFAIVSLAIYLYDRGPVIYKQRRVGRDNREFTIWKFRSMVPGADQLNEQYASANMANGLLFKLPDDPRVTPVGNLIRRLSIDELPQLFNVLFGDMSLVGPRPLPVAPEDFDPVAARRHLVRPGITGPWQVAGGHVLGYDDMIKLDLSYVDTWSLRKDLWYLAMTIPTVLVRRSAY